MKSLKIPIKVKKEITNNNELPTNIIIPIEFDEKSNNKN